MDQNTEVAKSLPLDALMFWKMKPIGFDESLLPPFTDQQSTAAQSTAAQLSEPRRLACVDTKIKAPISTKNAGLPSQGRQAGMGLEYSTVAVS